MVQLNILSGKQAGTVAVTRRFPFVVGRNATASLRLEEKGIWDGHLELDLPSPEGFLLKVCPGAAATLNDHPVQQAVLHNGDVIGIGSLKLQFWLSETRQTKLALREFLTWFALAALCAGQILLIYALVR